MCLSIEKDDRVKLKYGLYDLPPPTLGQVTENKNNIEKLSRDEKDLKLSETDDDKFYYDNYYPVALEHIIFVQHKIFTYMKNKGNTKLYQNGIFQVIQILLMIAFLINVWCLYTYIGDLEATYCKCATEQQKDVHYFLYIWRYILVASIVISLIMILLGAVFNNGK